MKQFLYWLDENAEKFSMGLLLSLMVILTAVQVVLRYFFKSSIVGVEEVVVYFNVWIGFLGCSYGMKFKNDMRVDLSSVLPCWLAVFLRTVSDVILFVFYIYIAYVGHAVIGRLIRTGQRSPAARIPMYVVYSAFMVGCVLAVFRYLQRVWRIVKSASK